ncbi:hypothetical protein L0F63_000607 [Massospora cicadina]|nr:hypothetical protein L0F63_000607 [Massospora cicadina]
MVSVGQVAIWLGIGGWVFGIRTVIDVLGSDPAYEAMVYLLQEARMIPQINRLEKCTLLALSNEALSKVDDLYPTHLDKERLVRYLLLKERLTVGEIYNRTAQSPLVETWLGLNGSLGTPDPFGPGRGQMMLAHVHPGVRSALYLGGVRVTRGDIFADNGVIHVVENYISFPKSPMSILMERHGLGFFSSLLSLTPSLKGELDAPVPHSLFVWGDGSANATFSPVERRYLRHRHPTAASDREALVASAFVNSTLEWPSVIYKQSLLPGHSLFSFNLAGDPVVVSRPWKEPQRLTYNGLATTETDILTSRGVIHYMIGFGASTFASAINSSSLAPYLLSGRANCTVLVPGDFGQPAPADTLRYHIIPGQRALEDFAGVRLVPSFLATERLNRHHQRIRVSVGAAGEIVFNGRSRVTGLQASIGGVSLLHVSNPLPTPHPMLDFISTSEDLSHFHNLVKAGGLEGFIKGVRGVTGLLPTNAAFQPHRQALLYDLLLRPANAATLRDFVRFCFMAPLKYSVDFKPEGSDYPTLLGNLTITVRGGRLAAGPAWDVPPELGSLDNLVADGVVHKTSGLLAPITRAAHLKGREYLRGHADIFLGLVARANLTRLFGSSGTVLAPTDGAWEGVNLTQLVTRPALLKRTVRLHFMSSRLPTQLDGLGRPLVIGTLSDELPDLRVVIGSPKAGSTGLGIRLLNGPMALRAWNASLIRSGQARDIAVGLIDQVLFLESVPSTGPTFLTAFLTTLLSLGGLGFVGYHVYLRYFPIQARGYSPIPDP